MRWQRKMGLEKRLEINWHSVTGWPKAKTMHFGLPTPTHSDLMPCYNTFAVVVLVDLALWIDLIVTGNLMLPPDQTGYHRTRHA